MAQKNPYSACTQPIIDHTDRVLLRRRIKLVLEDQAVALEVMQRLNLGLVPPPRAANGPMQNLTQVLVDFFEKSDGCAMAFLVGHERAARYAGAAS